MRTYLATLCFLLSMPGGAFCDETSDGQDSATDKKAPPAWLRYCNERSSQYRIYPMRQPKLPFERVSQAVILHTQPVRGDQLGAVYLWKTATGRPVAVGTTILAPETWLEGDTYYVVEEFHSLHDAPLEGQLGNRKWRCPDPGLLWEKIDSAPEPRGKFVVATGQARRIAKQFTAIAIDQRADNQKRPLRILPNPVYKYDLQGKSEDVKAGFVFAGCLATDPEFFLCLEVRKTGAGNRWHQAFAWFSDMQVEVSRKGKPVWNSPPRWGVIHTGGKTISGLTLPE